MNKVDTAKLVTLLSAVFASFKPTNETLDAYYELFIDMEGVDVLEAAKNLIKTKDRQPTISEIRKEVLKNKKLLPISKGDAWQLVREGSRKYGYDGFEKLSKELPHEVLRAVKIIGWRDICFSENIDVVRAHFWRAYEEIVESQTHKILLELQSNNQKEIEQ